MFFPVYLNLKAKRVVVVGGGEVAERKVLSLLGTGALIVVISPRFTAKLEALAAENRIQAHRRNYVHGDCAGAVLVFSAVDDPEAGRSVWKEASEANIFINTADQPSLCAFIMPAVVQRGNIGIAISTGGSSPALAARLGRKISRLIGPEYAILADLMARARSSVRARIQNEEERKAVQYRILDSNVLQLLRRHDLAGAEHRLQEIIEEFICEGKRA